jgi:MoaA/NifB/PqqE/SkfB family radical SAM enzyme
MGVECFKNIIKDLRRLHVQKIILAGQGEPLCHPNIADFIKTGIENGLQVLVRTNGIALERKCKDLAYSGKVRYEISLHAAHPEIWQLIHTGRTAKDFQGILDYISALPKKLRRNISLINVICQLNYREAPGIIKLAHCLGIKEVYFQLVIDRDLNDFGKRKVGLKEAEKPIILEKLLEAGENGRRFKIKTNLDCIISQIKSKFDSKPVDATGCAAGLDKSAACYVGYLNTLISSDGGILPCCNYGGSLGNIKDLSFSVIWNSLPYRNFRDYGKRGMFNMIPSCVYRECQYYGLNKKVQRVYKNT